MPPGWVEASLSEISTILMGQSPPSSTYNSDGHGLPFFQGKAEFCSLYPDTKVWCSRPGKIAEADDVLLSVRAPVGPTNLAPSRCCIGRGLAAIRPEPELKLKYLLYAFRRFAADLDTRGTGTTFKAVSGKVVREFTVPVPPSAEQSRIADLLDELFSDLDAGVAALERVREKLKLYRASILKAAVEGALTTEWRAQHPNVEPASELLQRILVERRRRWEEDQLARFKVKGQEPPKNWKVKYKEPGAPDTTSLPPLPERWCWETVNQCSALIQYGSSAKTNEDTQGIAVLRMGNLRSDGNLVLDELKYLPINHEEFPDLLLASGDLLFNRTNSSELVGKTGLYKGYPAPCSFASYLIRVRVLDGVLPSIVKYSLNGSHGRQWVKDVVNQTVGQANVNGTKLAGFVFPLPPLVEQEAIVEAVEDQLSVIDHLEADLDAKLKSAKALRQSILRHAFTGQLVPQDPNDEPASELLKRMAAARAERARESAAAKQETKVSNRPQTCRRGRPKKNAKGND